MAEPRKFVSIIDMKRLRDRVDSVRRELHEKAEGAARELENMIEELDQDDWKARFEYLVVAIQDYERGALSREELIAKNAQSIEGLGEVLHPEVRA